MLKDTRGRVYLDGTKVEDNSHFVAAGAKFRFMKDMSDGVALESLTSLGPTNSSLQLLVSK